MTLSALEIRWLSQAFSAQTSHFTLHLYLMGKETLSDSPFPRSQCTARHKVFSVMIPPLSRGCLLSPDWPAGSESRKKTPLISLSFPSLISGCGTWSKHGNEERLSLSWHIISPAQMILSSIYTQLWFLIHESSFLSKYPVDDFQEGNWRKWAGRGPWKK